MSMPALDPTAAPRPRRPTVRRVPPLEPPYDDELPEGPLRVIRQREELPFDEPAPRRFEHEIDFFYIAADLPERPSQPGGAGRPASCRR